mmetsp:Transcript_12694/g.32035  ORF Transcript_12694/g.32035 Transcript_12694/m.32035 type:complete len:309 (-) Transcript_12694:51-977(-)
MIEWGLLALAAATPPTLLVLGKTISSALSAPRPNSQPLGLKVVITGSSKGLGLALADKFLSLGDDVMITSRSQEACQAAAAALREKYPGRKVAYYACDVRSHVSVDALAAASVQELGRIDVWVNNAGVSQARKGPLHEAEGPVLEQVVSTNLMGAMFGCRAAIAVMRGQESGGKVFNMDGRGATGGATVGGAAYGASKRALPQLTQTLAAECKGSGVSVHITSPGMVITDLLVREEDRSNPSFVRIMNILAEQPATVADWMVPRMRGVTGNGKYFKFLTAPGVIWRFANAWRLRNRLLPMPAKAAKAS